MTNFITKKNMHKQEFMYRCNLSEDQFFGRKKINVSLYLPKLKNIPDGFNPNIKGTLYLPSLKSIPEGFNPIVGDNLDLSSCTSIPEGFSPIVKGTLNLSSLTSIPEGFSPNVVGNLWLKNMTIYNYNFCSYYCSDWKIKIFQKNKVRKNKKIIDGVVNNSSLLIQIKHTPKEELEGEFISLYK